MLIIFARFTGRIENGARVQMRWREEKEWFQLKCATCVQMQDLNDTLSFFLFIYILACRTLTRADCFDITNRNLAIRFNANYVSTTCQTTYTSRCNHEPFEHPEIYSDFLFLLVWMFLVIFSSGQSWFGQKRNYFMHSYGKSSMEFCNFDELKHSNFGLESIVLISIYNSDYWLRRLISQLLQLHFDVSGIIMVIGQKKNTVVEMWD